MANDGIDGIYLSSAYTQHSGNVTVSTKGNGSQCFYSDSGNFILNGGTLNATSERGRCIYTANGNVTITGGQVTATATRAGISAGGTITLGWTNATDRIKASSYSGTVKIAQGKALVDASNGNNYVIGDGNELSDEALGNIADKTLKPALLLTDNADNSAQVAALSGQVTTAILYGRTLYKDGAWNTLCLPFAIESGDLPSTIFKDAIIKRLDIQGKFNANGEKDDDNGEYETGHLDADGTMHIYFEPSVSITFYQPYIVKWNDDGSDNIVNPVFTNVTIYYNDQPHEFTSWEDGHANDGNLSFVCTSNNPVAIPVADKTRLYLGAANKLYWPSETNHTSFPYVTAETASSVIISPALGEYPIPHLTAEANLDDYFYVGPFRCYFRLNNGLTAGTPANPEQGGGTVRGFSLHFGDEGDGSQQTGIREINTDPTSGPSPAWEGSAAWYTIDGLRLDAKPTKPGLYIHNGSKVAIK